MAETKTETIHGIRLLVHGGEGEFILDCPTCFHSVIVKYIEKNSEVTCDNCGTTIRPVY